MPIRERLFAPGLVAVVVSLTGSGLAATPPEGIIHDAEHHILEAQHGEKWATEDTELDSRLAELRKKFGTPPNIIHIMWDDTALGEVGIPEIQAVRGFETPNMNRMADEGINFMRMYTSTGPGRLCDSLLWQMAPRRHRIQLRSQPGV